MGFATTVARVRADSNRANLNGNRDPQYSKSEQDENGGLGITQVALGHIKVKTYKNLYPKLCSYSNLEKAFEKAKEGKSSSPPVIEFEKNLKENLLQLNRELEALTYKPAPLKRFIIRDPKTRTIHSSIFKDRVVHHAIHNIIGPIFDKAFIYDSYANRISKGTHKAVLRFDAFKRKVSKNGHLVNNNYNNTSLVLGYVFKADIKHYFETVDHEILLNAIERRIKDQKVLQLIKVILLNYGVEQPPKGMPLGNLMSQFLANVYLNSFDHYVKHELKVKYYIRYVDDFVVLHQIKEELKKYKDQISNYLKNLKLELHPNKSKIIPLRDGITLLGYRIFYHHKILRKSNLRKFEKNFKKRLELYNKGLITKKDLLKSLKGWFGYAVWANTYRLRKNIIKRVRCQ